jgi:hypothetical protein
MVSDLNFHIASLRFGVTPLEGIHWVRVLRPWCLLHRTSQILKVTRMKNESQLIDSMQQNPWEARRHLAVQEISLQSKEHKCSTATCHWSLSYAKCVQSTHSRHIPLRSILILFPTYAKVFWKVFPLRFSDQNLVDISDYSHACCMPHPARR